MLYMIADNFNKEISKILLILKERRKKFMEENISLFTWYYDNKNLKR